MLVSMHVRVMIYKMEKQKWENIISTLIRDIINENYFHSKRSLFETDNFEVNYKRLKINRNYLWFELAQDFVFLYNKIFLIKTTLS